ncbi:MAG: YdeI/OmpD-associated family protein [Melioribacteraceae bacterium]|jgi:bifunctional DNA-binding transcriptional regulator/antitoxin component of YhaV-PrlF toxin-antitoxin module|nr:YdeI/OmpD-associated family protein [Melioribacteraceae bacterium]RJP58032.1 MAG: DUF1905 domain-containing protein [Ignavibacteriales bacterium]WKZ70372.1 MAG: YdeI/OmpD-associated family protein [Melioribacteraceae bacterium]
MKTYKFTAKLIKTKRGGYGVEFPYDARTEFGTGGMVKAKAKIGGINYRGSLTPMGGSNHMLIVLKDIRAKLGLKENDEIKIEIKQDTEERVVIIPNDLQEILKENKKAKEVFDRMSYTHRKEYSNWINEAKKPETREKRLIKTLEMLLANKHL